MDDWVLFNGVTRLNKGTVTLRLRVTEVLFKVKSYQLEIYLRYQD